MNEWNIQSRGRSCQGCEKSFADKQLYHTLLFTDKQEFRRLDICADCWAAQYEGGNERKNFLSYWHGVYEAPPAAPPEAIQKENAETLLRKLIELNDPKHGAACFILAVMLERKRLLKVKEQFKHEGKRVFIYEQPKTGDLFTITDPDLQLNQLDQVQRDVSNLLEHGLTPPPVENSTPPAEPVVESAETVANTEATPEATPETPASDAPSGEKSLDVA